MISHWMLASCSTPARQNYEVFQIETSDVRPPVEGSIKRAAGGVLQNKPSHGRAFDS
jgi:hypothetical protein